MKRALVLFCLGLTLPLAGCLNVKTCSQDSDCGGTGRCDVELRFCVFDPDSGLSATGGGGALGGGSGGGVTGGGGGVTGGGGGVMGGGGGVGPDPFCSIACPGLLECQPTRSGGTCVPIYVIAFTQPMVGQMFNGPMTTTAAFEVSLLRRTDGGASGLGSVPFSIPGLTSLVPPTVLALATPTTYGAAVNLPLETRGFRAFAGWDGGPLASVDFTIDRQPPVLTLELPAAGRFLRDAFVPVAIHSTKQLNPATLSLTLTGSSGSAVLQVAPFDAGFCTAQGLVLGVNDRCGQLDLASPVMSTGPTGLTATFGLDVGATDFGLNSATDTTTVPVTRLRWRSSAASAVNAVVRAAPALDSKGNLYVGTQDTPTTGRLTSLTPGGTLRFNVAVGAVQSVAIAESAVNNTPTELVYVSAVTGLSSGALRLLATDGGAVAFSACTDGSRPTYSAVALFDAGLAEVGAVLVFNPVGAAALSGSVCSFGPNAGSASVVIDPGFGQPNPDGMTVLSPANLVVLGKRAFVQRTDGALTSVDVNPLVLGGTSASLPGGTFPTGLALGPSALVGTWAGLSGAIQPIVTYALPPGIPVPITTVGAGWSTARPASILSGSVITSTNRPALHWLESMSLSGTALGTPGGVNAPASVLDQGATSVVVGTGNRVYALRRDGLLFVYDGRANSGVSTLSPVWSDNLFIGAVDVVAHPTLDCSRTAPGRPGTLYAVAADGKVAAIIVDSTKLEPNAPWPKWQRTAGNAGNSAFALNPGCP